jgi:hypothetical protein
MAIGPEIALAGAAIVLFGLIIFAIQLLLFTSLVISTTFDKKGPLLSVCGIVSWGIIVIHFCWQRGEGLLNFRIRNRLLWSRSLTRERFASVPAPHRRSSERMAIAWKPLLNEMWRAVGYLPTHLRVRSISADVVVGFPSAPTTGMAYGYFHAIKGILTPVTCISLHMTPDFDQTICDGRLSCDLEIRYPLILAFRLMSIGIRRPMRDVLLSGRTGS